MQTGRARRRVGGRRLRVSIEGRSRQGVAPLLLINGVGAPLELFEPLREALGDRLTVAFDVPGVGGSPTPLLPPTMRGLARTVADLVVEVSRELAAEVGTDRMDVLGLSWGGALAQELAHSHPRLVRRLVLAATMPGVVCVPGHPVVLAVMASPARYYCPGFLRAVAPLLYGREVRTYRERFERYLEVRTTLAPDPVGYTYQVSALARWTSPRSCSPATRTRSSRWRTPACWPAPSPALGCTSSGAVGTCSSCCGPRKLPRGSSRSWGNRPAEPSPPGR